MAMFSKYCKFCFCFPRPDVFIGELADRGTPLYKHLMAKWIRFREDYGEGAMIRFTLSLDEELAKKMDAFAESWVKDNA